MLTISALYAAKNGNLQIDAKNRWQSYQTVIIDFPDLDRRHNVSKQLQKQKQNNNTEYGKL